jgi:23S rRNA (adenine2503-C2)-methyltransferase
MGFNRNLDSSEIVEQFLFLNGEVNESRISNIVIMGMGEPLLNLCALRKALEMLCGKSGFGISKRKITVSTVGICEGIINIANNGPETELAVSIASAREELRNILIPGISRYPLSDLKEAITIYQKKTGRQITIETVLLGGINTGHEDAKALIGFTKNLDAIINVIPWNPVNELYFDNKKLMAPNPNELKEFISMLKNGGLIVTQRYRRGRSISGACGQLG